jgi:hypothetical protein
MATKREQRDDLMLDVLQGIQGTLVDIRDEAHATNRRLDDHGAKLDTLASISLTLIDRVDRLEDGAIKGFSVVRTELDGVNRRLDGLRDIAGDKVRELEVRVAALEARRT